MALSAVVDDLDLDVDTVDTAVGATAADDENVVVGKSPAPRLC